MNRVTRLSAAHGQVLPLPALNVAGLLLVALVLAVSVLGYDGVSMRLTT